MINFVLELAISSILILGYYLNNQVIILSASVIFLGSLVILKMPQKLRVIFFFIPWIYVLKINIDSTSSFTLGIFLLIILMTIDVIINKKRLDIILLTIILFFSIYILITTYVNTGSLGIVIKFFLNCSLFIYASLYINDKNYKDYILAYSLGLFTSGLVGLFIDQLNNIRYVIYLDVFSFNSEIFTRYSGLYWDPNYFGMQVAISISLLIVVYNFVPKIIYQILIIALALLGILTGSKAFVVLFILILAINFMFAFFIRGIKFLKNIWILILTISTIFIYFNNIIAIYLSRFFILSDNFTQDFSVSARLELWKRYFNLIFSSVGNFLFGVGIGNVSNSHNLYISLIYLLGLVGTLLFIFMLLQFLTSVVTPIFIDKTHYINYLPILVTTIYFFILEGFLEPFFIPLIILTLYSISFGKITNSNKVK